jgi:hypothetical protein
MAYRCHIKLHTAGSTYLGFVILDITKTSSNNCLLSVITGTTHSAARISVSHGVHRVMHDSPIVPFAIFLYGYARADSYGYPGGLRLADLTLECVPGKPGDGLDNDCDRRIDEEIKNFIDDDNDGIIIFACFLYCSPVQLGLCSVGPPFIC